MPVVIGDATLYLGDCRELVPSIEKNVALIVTSPPYNQMGSMPKKGSGTWGKSNGGSGFLREWAANPYEDSMDEHQYQESQNSLFSAIWDVCLPTASLFYNHQLRWRDSVCLHPINWFKPNRWALRQEIIWERGGGMMMNAKMFVRYDERILWFVHGDKWIWNQDQVGLGTIWKIAREQSQQIKQHPVAFPIGIPSRCIAAASDRGAVVLDPYMGSGTTGAAALSLGRKFVGIEISPKYFDIACRRIEAAHSQGRLFV